MSAPSWLERIEIFIDDQVDEAGLDPLEGWKEVFDMVKANIDQMEGH